MGRIVVGVDGSENSKAALRWAVDEARKGGDALEAVLAWQEPVVAGAAEAFSLGDVDSFEAEHRNRLSELVASVAASAGEVLIQQSLVRGHAADVLLDAADRADMLVVGTRGHGGFMGLLLGSVARQVVWHATCPVVVVPAPDTRTRS